MTNYDLIVFDVDGTLVNEFSSWVTIHEHFGRSNLAKENLTLYRTGDIDYDTFMKWDINLWPKPLHVSKIKEILMNYSLVSNVKQIFEEIKSFGLEIALLSAGIDILVESVANKLDVKYYMANGIEINSEGYLTGNGIFGVDLLRKDIALEKLLNKLSISKSRCIGVGDSKYDALFLDSSGYGIAIGNDDELIKMSNENICSLDNLIPIIKRIL